MTSFYVDDGSGERVRIALTNVNASASTKVFKTLSVEARERLRVFFADRGRELLSADVFEEECLRPGDRVSVVGLSQRDVGAPVSHLYRDAPSSELVVHAGPGDELIVATPESLRRERGGAFLAGRIAVAIGIVAVVGGLIARWIAPDWEPFS